MQAVCVMGAVQTVTRVSPLIPTCCTSLVIGKVSAGVDAPIPVLRAVARDPLLPRQ